VSSTVHDMEGERNVDPVWGRRQRISGERGFVTDLPQGGLSQKRIEEMYSSREPRLRPGSIQRLVTCIPNEEVDCLASLLLRSSLLKTITLACMQYQKMHEDEELVRLHFLAIPMKEQLSHTADNRCRLLE
jgi:hypothetical protein